MHDHMGPSRELVHERFVEHRALVQLEARVAEQMGHVLGRAGRLVVERHDPVAAREACRRGAIR